MIGWSDLSTRAHAPQPAAALLQPLQAFMLWHAHFSFNWATCVRNYSAFSRICRAGHALALARPRQQLAALHPTCPCRTGHPVSFLHDGHASHAVHCAPFPTQQRNAVTPCTRAFLSY